MKKFSVILSIALVFSTLTIVGCNSSDDKKTTTSKPEVTFQEPTVDISESVSVTFKTTATKASDKKATTTKKSATNPANKKSTTQYIPLVTTEYVAPTTKYTPPTTQYVAPTTKYTPPTTQYVAPTTKYVAPTTESYNPTYISYYTTSSTYLTASDVAGLSADTVQSIINDIYAHHGYIFKTPSIKAYYESQSWYSGTVSSEAECEALFNDCETYNKNFLAKYR
ncbi:MAG: YARHG domain-containing protein [Ruminococcus sp.]|nr:YARHG domain-containing protein [Ruminococcus sp.]